MRATVYHLGGTIGVCRLEDTQASYVAECKINPAGGIRVMPQTLRQVQAIYERELDVSEDAGPQDVADRLVMQLARFESRLDALDLDALAGADTTEAREGCERLVAGLAALSEAL